MSTLAAGLFLGAPGAVAAPTPPPPPSVSNPTNGQLQGADAQKAVIDQQVGVLSGQIAAAQARLEELRRRQELAEQKVALTYSRYQDAIAEAARAKTTAKTAAAKVRDAQVRFAQYMQATYVSGTPSGMTGTLLTASDPTALLDQTNYQQYEVEHNAGVIGQMQTLSVAKSNAQARAVVAQDKAKKAKVAAEKAQRDAAAAVEDQQSEQAGLEATMSQKQTELTAAKARVVQLYNNRATFVQYQRELAAYNAYVAEQRRIAAARKAAAEERARQRAAAARAKERAKARAQRDRERNRGNGGSNSNSDGGGGGGGGGSQNDDPPRNSPPAPTGGGWSQAKGNRAVSRAKAYLGDTYAWAGGNARGPTYGVCVSGAASNDCYIKGFDCSGLVMYAWGQNWDHYADTQYSQAGSYHPSISRLKPGDLMFFGYRGGGSDLHHVAMYVGHQKMIEAPQSNDVIQISSIYKYSDYYGATRPLT